MWFHEQGWYAYSLVLTSSSLNRNLVALQVQRILDLKYLPTAVQARIAGVKGIVSE